MSEEKKPRPSKVHGIVHLKAAAIYSIGGFKRLLQETSARHQFTAFALVLLLLFALGARGLDYLV
ncbi:MAG: diacylglycerol kinase, partial [Alphaproteobacteria bacterium]